MAIKEQLRSDLTAAMRARDEVTVATIRMALAAVQKAEVAGKQQVELSEEEVVAVLRTEIGRRAEAAQIYADAGRSDRAERERAEGAVLERYLPTQLDDAALEALVGEEVARAAEGGLTGPKATGAVIKAVRERAGSAAAGGRIAEVVKKALTGS